MVVLHYYTHFQLCRILSPELMHFATLLTPQWRHWLQQTSPLFAFTFAVPVAKRFLTAL
jgi:hypothetical protein